MLGSAPSRELYVFAHQRVSDLQDFVGLRVFGSGVQGLVVFGRRVWGDGSWDRIARWVRDQGLTAVLRFCSFGTG